MVHVVLLRLDALQCQEEEGMCIKSSARAKIVLAQFSILLFSPIFNTSEEPGDEIVGILLDITGVLLNLV